MRRDVFRFRLKDISKISWITFSVISITVLVFLSEWIQKVGIIIFPLGFRHVIILLLFFLNWLKFGRPIRLNQYYLFAVFLIFFYLIVSWIFVRVAPLNYLLGTGFTFLFIILFIIASNTKSDVSVILKIFKLLLMFFLIMSIGPILQGLLAGTTLRLIPGLFRELGAFGSSMNIGVIISLSLYIVTGEKKYIYFAIFLSFGVFLTILKKSIFSNIIIWIAFAYTHFSQKYRLKLIIYGIFFIALSFSMVGDKFVKDVKVNIDYYKRVGPEGHVRVAMYVASYKIAYDHFPFGSGMGTFGSLASIIGGYSQVYIDYGVSKIGANAPQYVKMGQHTLLDTYWPHILAELGFFGAAVFLFLWLFPLLSTGHSMHLFTDPTIRGLSFYVIMVVLIMTNDGFTLYNPEIPSFVLLNSGIGGLCYYHVRNRKMIQDEESFILKKSS